jgi:hypothetical protein
MRYYITEGQSQWSRGLRHELSSHARTLRSWIRIPLKARMSASYAFIQFVLFCVEVEAWRRSDLPSKESYRLYTASRN